MDSECDVAGVGLLKEGMLLLLMFCVVVEVAVDVVSTVVGVVLDVVVVVEAVDGMLEWGVVELLELLGLSLVKVVLMVRLVELGDGMAVEVVSVELFGACVEVFSAVEIVIVLFVVVDASVMFAFAVVPGVCVIA